MTFLLRHRVIFLPASVSFFQDPQFLRVRSFGFWQRLEARFQPQCHLFDPFMTDVYHGHHPFLVGDHYLVVGIHLACHLLVADSYCGQQVFIICSTSVYMVI
jgi:glutathione S-transferase